ncbi:hypothetical protein HGRIS_001055 [Hohenbuehelia grisea]|uniref:Uncharacterized protein n=1 Tax=Hohenbuehelia grisea TaxID=104357 RepID=A0ABR3JP47_9AGAR
MISKFYFNAANEEVVDEYLDFHIPPEGPGAGTSEKAKNPWDKLSSEFPFFKELHALLFTHPNVTPPAITTGVGPHGRKVVHYQPPNLPQNTQVPVPASSDPFHGLIDLVLVNNPPLNPVTLLRIPSLPKALDDAHVSSDKENVPLPATPTPKTKPKASQFGEHIKRANQKISVVPRKYLLNFKQKTSRQNVIAMAQENRCLMLEERKQLMDLFNQLKESLPARYDSVKPAPLAASPTPSKRGRLAKWDIEGDLLDESQQNIFE